MSLKANILANYLGQGWRALMSLAFVPVYINCLGIEAYGLIGIFVTLQAWLGLLDMGVRPALGREMARYTGGAHDAQSIWDLLRSAEIFTLVVSAFLAVLIWEASGWLATDWVRAEKLSHATIAQAFSVMGVVAALQFMESMYTSAIAGLQRQVLQNAVASVMATLRAVGAVAILVWVSPSIGAFFLWQGLVSLISVAAFASALYTVLPRPPRAARFSLTSLLAVRHYAAGMIAITLLSLLLTQVDKILLSRQLPLASFAHYMLAAAVAGALSMLSTPIGSAFYPRFTELAARADEDRLRVVYHQSAQLMTILLGAAAVMLMVFGDRLLLHWTRDPALAQQVAPLLGVMALGTMLNGLMGLPYLLQLAHGWTSLTIRVNCVAVVVLVPAILWIVPNFGAIGVAWVWTLLNAAYVLIAAHFMFRRLLVGEKWSWYIQDIGLPLAAALSVAVAWRWIMPADLGTVAEVALLLAIGASVALAAALACPLVQAELLRYARHRSKPIKT